MEYISSDTNVWLDFVTINRLDYPFRLPYTYLMNNDAIEDELLSPAGLGETLRRLGLQGTELSEEEFYLAMQYISQYIKLSKYDCAALAIAKVRGIVLLTGDGPLRKAAQNENVEVFGTIGVLDKMYEEEQLDQKEYIGCLEALLQHNGGKVRLPKEELLKRIEACQKE